MSDDPSSVAAVSDRRWFFSSAAAVQQLITECESWRRTPFRFGSRAKGIGGGTDCVGFCEAVMLAAGAVTQFNFPRGPEDNSRHVHNDKILNYLRGKIDDPQSAYLASRFAELPFIPQPSAFNLSLMPGDLLILKTGRGLYHMPIMMSSTAFMQCAYPQGVTEGDITAPNYRAYLVTAFRARGVPSTSLSKLDKLRLHTVLRDLGLPSSILHPPSSP
jgi:cell wall-associated NlpC family hydrolase